MTANPRRLRTPHAAAATLGILLASLAQPAAAERADRDKPTQIEGAQCVAAELKQVTVCTGNVVLVRGTLRITGERMEVREDPEGYRQATVTAATGQLATFRQRQDTTRPGVEEWVEGAAERIEYDERAETVKLLQRATWKRLENGQPRDEVAGNLITYDSRSATYSVAGGPATGSDGRVRLILSPRPDGAPAPAPAAPLTPAPSLTPPAAKK
ncbi:MAG: lipopolysaccharide transport periplasmic protein LptA [Burkholderiaceae bacterium]|jgi:lipopolysaccharide export system protein LptA|nr:lipopolysaccharide transport periplasmic protein LptA [Burkholderiaceae bacterium]